MMRLRIAVATLCTAAMIGAACAQDASNSQEPKRAGLTGTSTGEAIGTVGGNVPSLLALSLPAQGGSFGTAGSRATRSQAPLPHGSWS